MNKLFTKIATAFVGLAMAVGVGVAVASNSREATPVHAADTELTFSLTSNPGSWPTSSSAGNYNYTLSGTTYTFALGANVYCNSGYLILKSTTSLGLPAISGKKLTKIVASNSSGCSTSTRVGVSSSSSSASYITGGAYQTWSKTSSTYTYNLTGTSANTMYYLYITNKNCQITQLKLTYASDSTPLTGITLGGAASSNAMSIGSSDLTAKTVSVTLNPLGATDQKVNIAHQSGTSGLFTVSSSATCTSGSGSFTVTGKGNTSGSETFRIKGNTETGVYVDLVVTALDDSVTYWTVSFNSDGGASVADMSVEDGDTFEFPSPGTKDHYSFDGWSSDGGNTLYDAGDESPAVDDDIEYTAYWTEDAKYTVTYVHGDHGTGSNYVVNNVYGGSYTLATFATAGFEASSGYSFKKWSVGGVEYAEGATVTISGATTVTAVYQEVTTYTIVTSVANLVEDTTFVLVYETSGSYYVDTAISSNHVALTAKTAATTISNGVASGSTLVSTEAMVLTLKGSSSSGWKIKCGDKYLSFTGSSNGNDTFDVEANASTFSASIKDNKYILFTCTSSTGNGRVWRMNTSYHDMRNYATNSGVGDVYMFAYIPPQNELSSIALSGDYKTSFASGETFSFGGTVTASYTIDTDKTVTGSTTFHLDSAEGANMSGVTMTHAAHDGHTIYAKYTEGGITKTATYSISVANAPVSSLTIASNTGKVATKELFDMSSIGVTILPADAVKTYEWTVLSNTVNNDYTFEADIVEAGNTEGTITLKCTSTADSSKYQTFVLTVSGNPVVTLPNSVTLYTGKTTTVTASVEGGTSPYTYSWSITSGGSYASISSGGSSATVTLSGSAAGSVTLQCSVTDSNSKSDSASVTFSVIASAVTEVNWSASAFDVFSGATIPANIDDTWEVNYEKNNGDADYITFGDYELYLGSKEITSLPYTFVAEDDGKSLHVEYGGVSSSSVAVTVTQSINDVNASLTDSWDHTFTAKAWSAAGDWTISEKLWTMSGTDDGTPYFGYDATKGQQFGSGSHPYSDVSLQSSAFSGTVDSVTVYTSGANSINATVQVSVGGTAYGSAQTITNTNTPYTFDLGGKSGTISIDWVNSSSKAIYVKEIVVNTVSGSENIANNTSHKAAQRVAVAFAQAFNAAMDDTENCTTGLDAAWSTCSSAYNSFKTAAAALGETEEAYAKNLVKYATAQYSDDSAEACIERMMKTYEICVQKHGKTAFMSELVTLQAARVTPLATIVGNSNTVAIIVVISMISVTCIGGYFFLRKRKEN